MAHPAAHLSIRELREKCRNADYDLWRCRPMRAVSIYITKLFLLLNISANMTSLLGLILFLVGYGIFIVPDPLWRIVGLLLMLIGELLDYVDGELARAYGHSTKTGMFLEPFFQDIIYFLFFIAVGSSLYLETHAVIYLYLGILGGFGKIFFRLTELRFKWHMERFSLKDPSTASSKSSEEPIRFSLLSRLHHFAVEIHHNFLSGAPMLYILFIALLFERLDLFMWAYGILLPLYWIALCALRLKTIMGLSHQSVQ